MVQFSSIDWLWNFLQRPCQEDTFLTPPPALEPEVDLRCERGFSPTFQWKVDLTFHLKHHDAAWPLSLLFAFGRSFLFLLKWPTDEMWNKGAGAALPHQHTQLDTDRTMFRLRPWSPPPQSAVSLWLALKTTSHRVHASAATLPRRISTWTHLLPWQSGAPCLVPWPHPPSLWTSLSMLASSPQTRGPRVALRSWPLPPHLSGLALSAEEVTSWRGRWPSSVAQGAAAVCRAQTHQVGMEACMAQPVAAAIMTQRWMTQTWRGNCRDSGRSKDSCFSYSHIKFLYRKMFCYLAFKWPVSPSLYLLRHLREISELQAHQRGEVELLYNRLGKAAPPGLGLSHTAPHNGRRKRSTRHKLKPGKLLSPLVQQFRNVTTKSSDSSRSGECLFWISSVQKKRQHCSDACVCFQLLLLLQA